MSKLVVDELKTTLSQSITLTQDRIYHIGGIKINLFMYNSPSGTFTLSLKQGATTLVSETFTSAELKSDLSTSDDYLYLYKAFSLNARLKKGTYTLEISSSGYTYSSSSFLGWIKSHENIFNEQSDTPIDFTYNPFDYLIYERVREDLVR